MGRIRYHKKKAALLRLVKTVKGLLPDAWETAVGIYTGMAPVTVPITAMIAIGGIEKIISLLF